MAKFCTNCGKPLDESGVCSCQKNTKENSGETKNFGEYFNKIMDIAKGLVKTPNDIAKKYVSEKNYIEGMIMIALASLVLSLFVLVCAKQIFTSNMVNSGISLGGFMGTMGDVQVNIPYFQIFIKVCIGALVMFFGTTCILHVVNTQIFKAKGTLKGMVSLVGTASLYISVLGVFSIILAFLSTPLALFVFGLAFMLYFYYLYTGMKYVTSAKENSYAYIIVTSYIIGTLLIFLITKIFS